MLAVPKEPTLHKNGNGQIVIRYPIASRNKPGKTIARVYKLGFGLSEAEQQQQLAVFKKEHAVTGNGKGKALMVVAQPTKKKYKGKYKTGDEVPTYLIGKTPAEIDAIRERNRVSSRERNAAKRQQRESGNGHASNGMAHGNLGNRNAARSHVDLTSVQDHIGILIASVSAISTSLRMLQEIVTNLQKR